MARGAQISTWLCKRYKINGDEEEKKKVKATVRKHTFDTCAFVVAKLPARLAVAGVVPGSQA